MSKGEGEKDAAVEARLAKKEETALERACDTSEHTAKRSPACVTLTAAGSCLRTREP